MEPREGTTAAPAPERKRAARWKAAAAVGAAAVPVVLALAAWRFGAHTTTGPSIANVTGEDGGPCRVVSDHRRPLVVDWEPQDRADIEEAIHDGLAVVSYDCNTLRLLTDCSADGTYDFVPVSRKEDVVQVKSKNELLAKLSGRLEIDGELSQGMVLDVAEILIGKKRTATHHLAKAELRGIGCSQATHFVREAYVGAFALGLEQEGKARSAGSIFSGSGEAQKVSRYRDGQPDECKQLPEDAKAAASSCNALVRLELEPIDVLADAPVAVTVATLASVASTTAPADGATPDAATTVPKWQPRRVELDRDGWRHLGRPVKIRPPDWELAVEVACLKDLEECESDDSRCTAARRYLGENVCEVSLDPKIRSTIPMDSYQCHLKYRCGEDVNRPH